MRTTSLDITCLILAGGKGTRLRPITASIPKPLVKVAGKPIIDYAIDHCLLHGIENFLILSGYLSSKVADHVSFLSSRYNEIDFKVIDSGDVDIIERIKQALNFVKTKYLIILYGDTISDVNIDEILNFHKKHNAISTMATWQIKTNFGVIESDNSNLVLEYKEKPKMNVWINIGYIVLTAERVECINKYNTFQSFLESLVDKQNLYSYRHDGFHYTVNNFAELQDAEEYLVKMHQKEEKGG